MKDHPIGQHRKRMHRPGSFKFSSCKKVHRSSQSTSWTPAKPQMIQGAECEMRLCTRLNRQDGKQTSDPENQFQGNASKPGDEFFHVWECTKKVPAGKSASKCDSGPTIQNNC